MQGPVFPSRKVPCGGPFFQLTCEQSPAQEDVGGKRKRAEVSGLFPGEGLLVQRSDFWPMMFQ